MPFSTWWKKMGCASRALEPQRMITSVSSASRYELVPPPAPNTVARPTTLGACQVRLHESMLLDPITERANFCARKFTSFEAFEQLNIPNERVASCARARASPAAAKSSASSHPAGRSEPFSRTNGSVSRPRVFGNPITSSPHEGREAVDERLQRSRAEPLNRIPLLHRPDNDPRDLPQILGIPDELRNSELRTLAVVTNDRHGNRLSPGILAEFPITPVIEPRDPADRTTRHLATVPQNSARETLTSRPSAARSASERPLTRSQPPRIASSSPPATRERCRHLPGRGQTDPRSQRTRAG